MGDAVLLLVSGLFYESEHVLLFDADCSKERPVSDGVISSLVTDPPAGISFMGEKWDGAKKGREAWVGWAAACFGNAYLALKPGAYGLVWALPRRSHWTALALEDAGFELLDIVHHIFGEGWPKNHDLSVAIDKEAGAVREVIGRKNNTYDGAVRHPEKHSNPAADASFGSWGLKKTPHGLPLTRPSTEAAKKWDGWGTALKPATEHWLLVRKKPSEKTLAQNLIKHGVGGININQSKLESGRWPANLVHDDLAIEAPHAKFFYAAKPSKQERNLGCAALNQHPTVKPIALMEYLVRLVTPPGGIVMDIFAGTATTGIAALRQGFEFVGLENNPAYLQTAKERLMAIEDYRLRKT